MNANERLNEYLKDKTVAYVCSSPHLIGKNLGSYIDSFDIVIRCNQHWDIPQNRKIDYGSRTDVLISNMNGFSVEEMRKKKDYNYMNGIKYILALAKPNEIEYILSSELRFNSENFAMLTDKDWNVCNMAHTGFIALIYLLKQEIKKMFLCGMSFYNMGEYGKIWYDEFFDEQLKQGEIPSYYEIETKSVSKKILQQPGAHDIESEINCFKNFILPTYRHKLEVDFYLKEKFGV